MRISYSGLDTFSTCPAKYKFQYVERIKTPKSKEAVFGTLIHDCLKTFHEPSRTIPLSEEELLKSFTEKWNSDLYPDKQEEAFAFHQGIEILKNYYLQNQTTDFNIINLEAAFEIPISDNQEVHKITGRIDRIDKLSDGSFEVIDYKTSKKMPPQEQVDKNLQLSIYYLGLINRWPSIQEQNRPIKLSLYYLRHGEKLSTVRDSQQAKESQERILSLVSQIKESSFHPKVNPLCNWCQYQSLCPLFRHKFTNTESPTLDDQKIQTIIKEYFEIKEKQGQSSKRMVELKQLINQYCDQNDFDRVFSDAGYITRLSQQRFSYDMDKVKQILEPIGKWDEILTIDKVELKKTISSLPNQLQKKIDQAKTLDKEFKVITISKNK